MRAIVRCEVFALSCVLLGACGKSPANVPLGFGLRSGTPEAALVDELGGRLTLADTYPSFEGSQRLVSEYSSDAALFREYVPVALILEDGKLMAIRSCGDRSKIDRLLRLEAVTVEKFSSTKTPGGAVVSYHINAEGMDCLTLFDPSWRKDVPLLP